MTNSIGSVLKRIVLVFRHNPVFFLALGFVAALPYFFGFVIDIDDVNDLGSVYTRNVI